ncbi:MAG: hypothetical protein WC933_03070 [Candidatus Paceibacterota bacterium]|jgi:hypothetical protein
MDNTIFSKFNIYDQIGYLMVGSVGLLVLAFSFYLFEVAYVIPSFNLDNSLMWFIVAYLFGHVLQAGANIFVKENKVNFSDSEKEILERVSVYFNVAKQSWGEVYSLCYMSSSAKDITGQVQSFNAYYSLYRGWMILFGLNSISMLILNIMHWFFIGYLSFFVLSIILTWLFYNRSKRFYGYLRAKTLQTFLINITNK